MLFLSRELMASFEDLAFQRFEQQLLSHVREHFPGHVRYLGEQGALRVIRNGCALAEERGFKSERDLSLYTDLTLMLGAGFDSDPQMVWVPEIMEDPTLTDPRSRMDALWDQAMLYLEHVLGPDAVLPKRAYERDRSQKNRWRRLVGIGRLTAMNEQTLLEYFHGIWPEKAEYVGADALRTLVAQGLETASRHVSTSVGLAEFLIHAFLFGHQFHADPQYPWVSEILKDKTMGDGHERIVQIAVAFDTHLKEALN